LHERQVVFGAALDRVAGAETLHLKITRGGEAAEVWYAQPNRLRWDAADGTYKIARGETLWRVDESQNLAASEPAALFGTDAARRPGVDLLALLEVDNPEARSALAGQMPVETTERDGRKLLRYHFELPAEPEPLTVDALVDLETQMVASFAIQALRNGRLEPVAELNVLAVNAPVAEEKFVVRDTLTEDGRVGKIVDAQGLVCVKPVMHSRWTAVCGKTFLKPGDWVRTDNRGANATTLKIVKQSQVILGPASLVEIVSPAQVRVHSGEFEVRAGEKDSLELVGPDGEKVAVTGTQIFRVRNEKLARLQKEPLWLKGFKGTENAESIGSLIAKVDGRAVPLTVGYHKVTVDIRDQIARTVIEESFVNHTNGILEGVFYFPLPDDASISGFGMWIGDELVEADVVEKQRAREIYETIKHEKRDPGLLEWSGGNLFKASVYPISPNSEKRIKISYTQVLPVRGNSYRYSYALQSELLKLNPLRELAIDVKVNSAVPLKNISSPTHTVRADRTDHAAHVEFAAQDYTPPRDFEVVVETGGRQSEVVVIPHRRGDDGYFMLQLTPPATGDWQREVLPDGEPLQLLILADTSASMDAGQRKRQQEVVAALLAGLTPRDTVNLAGCDVECDWVFEKPVAADPKSIAAVRSFLEKRHSLGWTSLDAAFASAFKQSGPKTHIVYIGDGIVTTGDARPEGFAQRVKQAYRDAAGTCHAVAVGSSFEPAVLKAIASLGSGSLRRVSGEERPAMVATALLREMAQPGLRDLKIEFRGLQTARVYPEELPNVPVGSQQILLGLYRPVFDGKGGADQTGDVVVTATQDGKPVKFAAKVSLKDAEEGNSFIPRLWAKMHLDALLAQGTSPAIRDETIALSEEFQIMTPYTSFLVLESDADRERFKVKRRFRMRDGEKYFQEGRDTASFELVQKQMQRAGNWRLGLRRMALRRLALLGRDARLFQPPQPMWMTGPYGGSIDIFSVSGAWTATAGAAAGFGGRGGGESLFFDREVDEASAEYGYSLDGALPALGRASGADSEDRTAASESSPDPREPFGERKEMEAGESAGEDDVKPGELKDEALREEGREDVSGKSLIDEKFLFEFDGEMDDRGRFSNRFPDDGIVGGQHLFGRYRRIWNRPDYTSWVNTLFPALPAAETPKKARPQKFTWPLAARELSHSLLRTDALSVLAGGLEIAREAQGYEARWNELTSRQRRLDLYSKAAWLTRTEADSHQTLVHWANATERGVMGLAFGLGRIRKSAASDLTPAVLDRSDYAYLGLNDHSLAPLHETYRDYTPKIERQDDDRTLLILTLPRAPKYEMRIAIDTARHVILSIEQRNDGKLTARTTFDDFVEVAGCWWARRIEMTDDAGRRTWLITQTVQPLAGEAFAARLKTEIAPREKVQLIRLPLPTVAEAKRAQSRLGELTLDSQLVLLLHFARSQQWQRVFDQLEMCEKLTAGKPGAHWLRSAVLSIARRHDELKGWLTEEAAKGVAGAWKLPGHDQRDPQAVSGDEVFLAEHLIGQGGNFLEAREQMRLHDLLKPVYERQPAHRQALKGWKERHVGYLQSTGQPDAALREMKQVAVESPRDWNLQQRYAQNLFSNSDFDAAYDWLKMTRADNAGRRPDEEDNLRGTYANFLLQQGRYAELAEYYAKWIERSAENSTVYQQYLAALIQADRVAKADALMAEWFKAGAAAGELSPVAAARLSGAVWVALGHGYFFYTDRIEEQWQAPLADVVIAAARSDRELSLASQII
ncbi:MAG: VIT domain-containing protein, partial [Deltaproteobacteria bacterium]